MKITVKYKDATIIVDETDNNSKDKKTSLKWSDERKYVEDTIIVMVEQCNKLECSN